MKDPAKIFAYFVGVVLLGCLLAPPFFWAGEALSQHGVLPSLQGVGFKKYFHRAMLVAALGLLWPLARSLRLHSLEGLGLIPNPRWGRHLLAGFAVAAIAVGIMAAVYIALGIYQWKTVLPWGRIPKLALSAAVVGLLEESLFRGVFLGVFQRNMSARTSLLSVTLLFSSLHFLKPDKETLTGPVNWLSGFQLLPGAFHQFAEPGLWLASFSTIFVLGWVAGMARQLTRSLWLSIGFHAGIVFVKMGFSKLTERHQQFLPWVGPELQIGLVPVAILLACGWVLWRQLQHAQHGELGEKGRDNGADNPAGTSIR